MKKNIFRMLAVVLIFTGIAKGENEGIDEINQARKKIEVVLNPMKNSFEVKTQLECSNMFLIENGAKKIVFYEYGRGDQEFFPDLEKGSYVVKVISAHKSLVQRIRV